MSTQLHVVKKVKYDDDTLEYCEAYDNPIADNLSNYLSEVPQYYMTGGDFDQFKKDALEDIEKLSDEADRSYYKRLLDNMEKKVKGGYEIIIEAF